MYENTQDLSQFGYREKEEAATLLQAQGSHRDDTQFLGDGVNVEFNPMSGYVFLVDEDYHVAMMNGDRLEDFHTCFDCGGEGLASDFIEDNGSSRCCLQTAADLGLEGADKALEAFEEE
mgnify:CR=1 FL=1